MKKQINKDLVAAMKANDAVKKSTLRALKTAITNKEKEVKNAELSDDEVIAVVRSEQKKRLDAQEMYASAGKEDKAAHERAEFDILQVYLPQQLSQEEVDAKVGEVIAGMGGVDNAKENKKAFGIIMGKAKALVGNTCSTKDLSDAIKRAIR